MQITENAARKVMQLMAAEQKDGYGLRIAVQGGGCSGFQYGMSYDNEPRENDSVLEFHGLTVYVDGVSSLYLDDVQIDYVDGLAESGFKFNNPKATGTCGCGSSFSM